MKDKGQLPDAKTPPIDPPTTPEPAPAAPQGDPIAVQIDIATYKDVMLILSDLPYKQVSGVMARLAPGVKAIYADQAKIVDPNGKEGAE